MNTITLEQILNVDPFLNGMFVVLFAFTAVTLWQKWRDRPEAVALTSLKAKKSA